MTRGIDFEEEFHDQDRKKWRKERKLAQANDRSKFKKTDQTRKGPAQIDPSWKRGRVISISGEGIWVVSEGKKLFASLKGLLKKEKKQTKNILAVGDFVRFTEDLAIAHIEERHSFLARSDITGKKEQLIAVNIDQAIIIASVANPVLKPALIDRYLIAAEKGNIHPIIVINKIDLLDSAKPSEIARYEEFISVYEKLGFPILSISTKTLTGIEALKALLKDKSSVFSGQSGVGKSTLLNVTYGLNLKTGGLAHKTSKGTHTTTTAEFIPLSGGGYCVDTPGIRSFGVWKLKKDEVTNHFKDFSGYPCKYANCIHINEPECKVLEAIESGHISPLRYESYKSLLDEAAGGLDNRSKRKVSNELD